MSSEMSQKWSLQKLYYKDYWHNYQMMPLKHSSTYINGTISIKTTHFLYKLSDKEHWYIAPYSFLIVWGIKPHLV